MAGPEPPQAVLNSLQLLQEPRAVLNLVQAVLNSLQHLQEPRAVLNSLLSLGAQQSKTKQSKSIEDKSKQKQIKEKQKQKQQHHHHHHHLLPKPFRLKPGGPATQPLTPMFRGWRSEASSGAAQPASAPGGAAQPTPPAVAIDVGDVASKRNDDQRVEGSEMYTAVEDGFWAFVVLFAAEFGLQDMHFISRTTRGTWHSPHAHLGRVEAWVVRLIRSTGWP